jgi:hypothetical protein
LERDVRAGWRYSEGRELSLPCKMSICRVIRKKAARDSPISSTKFVVRQRVATMAP